MDTFLKIPEIPKFCRCRITGTSCTELILSKNYKKWHGILDVRTEIDSGVSGRKIKLSRVQNQEQGWSEDYSNSAGYFSHKIVWVELPREENSEWEYIAHQWVEQAQEEHQKRTKKSLTPECTGSLGIISLRVSTEVSYRSEWGQKGSTECQSKQLDGVL